MANRPEDIFNAASSSVRDFFHEVSEGHIPGHSGIYLFGQNDNLSANVEETLWSGSGTWVSPTGASRVNIYSASAADTSSGLGARSVFITGVDGDYNTVRENVTISGVTNILSSNSYIAINEMVISSAGASGVNVGIIYANQQSSSLLLNCIAANNGISQSLLYTVPAGSEAHITRLVCSSSKISAGTAPKVTFTGKIYNPISGTRITGFEDTIDTDVAQTVVVEQPIPYVITEKTTAFVNVISDQNNTVSHGRLYIV